MDRILFTIICETPAPSVRVCEALLVKENLHG